MIDDLTFGLIIFAAIAFYQWLRANFWRHIHRKKIDEYSEKLNRIQEGLERQSLVIENDSILDAEEIY